MQKEQEVQLIGYLDETVPWSIVDLGMGRNLYRIVLSL